jgi:DNA-binding MarR family transcriptional regulator
LINKGKGAAKKLTHAHIILAIDESEANTGNIRPLKDIAEQLHVSVKTIERIRKTLVEEGLDKALNRKKHTRSRTPIIQGQEEAQLIALACSNPPSGQSRWTLKLGSMLLSVD